MSLQSTRASYDLMTDDHADPLRDELTGETREHRPQSYVLAR